MGVFVSVVRRSLWVLLIAAVGGGAYAFWRDRNGSGDADPAEWPPLVPERDVAPPSVETTASASWIEPLDDGSCPLTNPVKANDNSGIFHIPGGRFYERTNAERCYASAEAATADGYRQAKN